MTKSDRRRITVTALAALDGEIGVRRAELAALERARDTLARGDRCDLDSSLCAGLVHTALCRVCGHVVRRCLAHGAARSATTALRYHDNEEHGPGWSASAETLDTGGVLPDGEAVSLGCLPPPPTPDRERGPDPAQPPEPIEAAEPRPEGE
jgi:hypothetical protein